MYEPLELGLDKVNEKALKILVFTWMENGEKEVKEWMPLIYRITLFGFANACKTSLSIT